MVRFSTVGEEHCVGLFEGINLRELKMKRYVTAALLATAAIVPAATFAATVNTALIYERNNVGLDGGNPVGFDKFTNVDVGIARLRFGAKASGGDVDADGAINFSTTFDDNVALAAASSVSVSMSLNSLNFGYDAFTGADAGAFVDFNPFAGVNLREFRVIGDAYVLETDDRRNGFGSTGTERSTQRLTGVGPNASLGLGIRAEVTLDASQTTSFSVDNLEGTLMATHTSGAIRSEDFALLGDATSILDLGLEGEWTLQLFDVALRNSFDSATGISAGYEIGVAAGEILGGCGDYSTDSDNAGFFDLPAACLADAGVSGDTSQLSLLNPSPFEILWGTKSVSLGSINVLGDPTPVPVPLPAGLPLLLAALGVLGLTNQRKAA